MPESCQVFISYRRTDQAVAERLFALLQARDVAAWYDALIPPSADWRDTIVAQLSQAKVMVILLSAAALESEELKKELAVANQERVPLLAARLENVKPKAAFAYELARGNWFDVFSHGDGGLEKLAGLLAGLVRDPGRIPSTLEASSQARLERQRREAWGRLAFLRRPSTILALIALTSLIVLWLYDMRASPLERLAAGGVAPLTAYLYVGAAVTVGSPLLAMSVLTGGLSLSSLPLLAAAVCNSALICVLLYMVVRDLRVGLRRLLPG